jgi:putative ABC transport system substrate-binding protein
MSGVRRREFITLLGGAAAAWPIASRAGTLKVGMISAGSQSRSAPNVLAFRQRLSDLGYREGNNITFEFAHATDVEDFARGYREMVARTVDILVAPGPEIALQSALAATNTLPIVTVAIDYDPIARGYVKSLPRPGGNITGIFLQ